MVMYLILAVFLGAGSASAVPFPPNVANDVYDLTPPIPDGIPTARSNNDGIPDIYHAINQLLGTSYTSNGDVDYLFTEPDYVWERGGVVLIGLTAGNSNTLGVYDPGDPGTRTPVIGPYTGFGFLGDGSFDDPYPAAEIAAGFPTPFGFYLQSNDAFYYSEPYLNSPDWDHMMTYDLGVLAGQTVWLYDPVTFAKWEYTFIHPYLAAWEDLNMGDMDYDDMIYLYQAVARVPEPATMLLVGSGLIGLAVLGRKRFLKKA